MSETMYIWAHLENGDKRTCGYIENKPGVKVGAMVEMIDIDGQFWKISRLSDEKPRSYVIGQKNKGRDFAHSLT